MGSSPSGTKRDADANGEQKGLRGRQSEQQRGATQHAAGDSRDDRDDPHDPIELNGEWAERSVRLPGQRGDTRDGRLAAGRLDHGLALALHDEGAGHHRLALRTPYRGALAGDHRLVDCERVRDGQLQVGTDAVAGTEDDQVAAHEFAGVDDPQLAVATDPGGQRQHRPQAFSRPVRPVLLREREEGIEKDDHHDGGGQRRLAGQQRQAAGHPEQHGQQMGELMAQLAKR